MPLAQEIAAWDGKAVDVIAAVYKEHETSPDFVEDLLKLMANPAHQVGVTWLLKHYLENDRTFTTREANAFYRSVAELESWASRLHVLQSIPNLTIAASSKKRVERFVRKCLVDEVKFVRAWAYYALYVLACQYPEYRTEALQILKMGQRDEPASVQVRIRKALEQGFADY